MAMEINCGLVKNLIIFKKEKEIQELLNLGWNPNAGGGWPIRLAARYGCCSIVETFIRYGANPHLLSESGASTLQLAVYSSEHWGSNRWSFLLSCCDSSQLADGAAVAIVFNNSAALERILETGRCNAHIPTSLTGKTLEQLAKGYKMPHLLNTPSVLRTHSPRTTRTHRRSEDVRNTLTPHEQQGNLSPSVARFFQQTAGQSSLTSPRRSATDVSSPTAHYL